MLPYHIDTSVSCIIIIHCTEISMVKPIFNSIVEEGNGTTVTCEATGFPPPTTVWSRTNGILSNRVSVSESFSTLTNNGNVTRVSLNLTITNVSREDTGVYSCSATNSIGSHRINVSITVQCKLILFIMFS